jgi:Bacterial Ig domain/IPT/TIG domain/Putative collagen-binding domain of a collagenase
MHFAMKTITFSETFQRIGLSMLLLALVMTKAGCNGGTSNPAGGNPPQANIASLSPTSGVIGTSVTITGANFGATQGTSTVKFNGTTATPTSWSATSIIAPVPAGTTTGNVVVTVGGAASNGMSFTVTPDTTAPVVTITAPTNNATVSGTSTLTATATDPDSPVSFVQFLVDGSNTGAQLRSAPYSILLDTTTLPNGSHILTATAQDPAGNQRTSTPVTIMVSNVTGTGAMGPLIQSPTNNHWFQSPNGKAVAIFGSHTWNNVQDEDNSGAGGSTAQVNFTNYVNFLVAHRQNSTVLWHKDLPTFCNWGAQGTWTIDSTTGMPWARPAGPNASDGKPKFDLNTFNQAFFDRVRARVMQLQQNGIYAVVELFDGLGLTSNRCSSIASPNGDGYPFTGVNNINGIDDGFTGANDGTQSMTMSATNAITNIQDAYVRKMVDTLNDLQNVIWEPSEEAPDNSTFWNTHMISLIQTYEAGKPLQHPVLYATLNINSAADSTLYNSNAMVVAPVARFPAVNGNCGSGSPACKVVYNDSDHSYFGMWNDSAQVNRQFIWQNFLNGNNVGFMDPYLIFAGASNPNWTNRNNCTGAVNGVCSAPDPRWDNMRDNLGYTLSYANKMDLAKMTPQGSLSSTGFCLADNAATGAEYLIYAPSGGTFTVNLSATTQLLNVEWLNPTTGATTAGAPITGGSASQSFTPPVSFTGDAVLYIVDAAGHN